MNEVQVDLDENGHVRLRRAGGDEGIYTLETTEASRAFFQAERDETPGRWRDPEHPDWVVYPLADGTVMVFNEQSQYRGFWSRKGTRECALKWGSADVARRYFQAHPEPKPRPWEEAKPGEIWEIGLLELGPSACLVTEGDFVEISKRFEVAIGSSLIESGRRIWPEPRIGGAE